MGAAMTEHIWMEHNITHGRALLPDLPYWKAIGWEPCDGPPPEPDLTRDPQPEPEPEVKQESKATHTAEHPRKSKTARE